MKIIQIIKYEGDNESIIWKHPSEDFNIGSQLIVHESQEAIFFMNGQALDLFGPGRYTLTTQNIPIISKILNKFMGDETPFHCEVYFINKTEQMALKWGTDSQIEYMEPTFKFPIKIGASGEMSMRNEDSKKFLVKIVGTEKGITWQQIVQKLRGFLMIHIKPYLANIIREESINIFTIDEHLMEISKALQECLATDFVEYGLVLEHFFITTIVKPEEDKLYQKFRELHFRQYADVTEAQLRQQVGIIEQQTQAQRMVIEAQGISQKRALEGYTYQEERGFDVAKQIASNEAVGNFTNAGIGLGMMSGIGVPVSKIVTNVLNPIVSNEAKVPDTPVAATVESKTMQIDKDSLDTFKKKIEKLKAMWDMKLLTEEEFEEEKKKLLISI